MRRSPRLRLPKVPSAAISCVLLLKYLEVGLFDSGIVIDYDITVAAATRRRPGTEKGDERAHALPTRRHAAQTFSGVAGISSPAPASPGMASAMALMMVAIAAVVAA